MAVTNIDLPDDTPFGPAALPYAVTSDGRVVSRIGDHVIHLHVLQEARHLGGDLPHGTFASGSLNAFLALGRSAWDGVRRDLQAAIAPGGVLETDAELAGQTFQKLDDVSLVLPIEVADYVDFYCSINHATNLGRLFRPDSEPLLPNWRHLPVGYHGRAGTLAVSGTDVVRPNGLRKGPEPDPTFGPSRRLDFELELGFVIGAASTVGEPVDIKNVDDHVFGFCLVNDWSARDIQAYEYIPLGPFLGKSFLTSIAPWIVPVAAVAPAFQTPPEQDPMPVSYLRTPDDKGLPVDLEVLIQTAAMRDAGTPAAVISTTNFDDMYWTYAQMVAHCAVNGASLRTGDLYASGTISGTEPGTYGSMIELSWGGKEPVAVGDEERTFLQDGDTVIIRGVTTLPNGTRIGFGEVSGTVQPAREAYDATP